MTDRQQRTSPLTTDELLDELARRDEAESAGTVNATADSDSTIRVFNFKAELDTLAGELRDPAPVVPFEDESDCRRVIGLVEALRGEPSVAQPTTADIASAAADPLGDLGQYKLLSKLGEGGMGTVYKALHTRLDKIVALKVLPWQKTTDAQAIARFEREMRAIGKLEHTHIVRAVDANVHQQTHYLVMEYIDGVNLSELVDRVGPLPIAVACELVRQAALGLQYAHEHDRIHRDLKPSNLMLSWTGQVKILDLGLALLPARSIEKGPLTASGQVMGTLEFMAPEQANNAHFVDHRADIYSLGCTLYYLLNGTPPISQSDFPGVVSLLMAIANDSPTSISDRRPELPGEVVSLVHRMLAKAPEHRIQSAGEIACALEPFSTKHHELTELLERVRTTARVNTELNPPRGSTFGPVAPAVVDTTIDLGPHVAVPRGPVVSERTVQRRPKTGRTRWAIAIAAAFGIVFLAVVVRVVTNRGELVIITDDPTVKVIVSQSGENVRIIDTQTDQVIDLWAGEYQIELAAGEERLKLSTDRFTLTRGNREVVRVERRDVPTETGAAAAVVRTPNTSATAHASSFDDGIKSLRTFTGHVGQVNCVAISRDGKHALTGGIDQTVRLWNLVTGLEVPRGMNHSGPVWSVAISPDGGQAVSAGNDYSGTDFSIRLWDLASGSETRRLTGHDSKVNGVAFSSDGQFIVSGASDGTARHWRVDDGMELSSLSYECSVTCVAISPDNRIAALGYADGGIRLWDLITRKELRTLLGHWEWIRSVAFSPDGQFVLSASLDTTMRLWDVKSGDIVRTVDGHQTGVGNAVFVPGGRFAISTSGELNRKSGFTTAGWDDRLRLWSVETGQELRRWPSAIDVVQAAVSPDGRSVIAAGVSGVREWSLPDSQALTRQDGPRAFATTGALAWPADRLAKGTIRAPSLTEITPVANDDFDNPDSGFVTGLIDKDDPFPAEFGYESGRYAITCAYRGVYDSSPWYQYANFACQAIGRVTTPEAGLWGVSFINGQDHGVNVTIDNRGQVEISPDFFEVEKFRGPQVGPFRHPAVKSGSEFNKLLVIVRGRQLEVYVNDVAVAQPIDLDRDITPSYPRFVYGKVKSRTDNRPTRVELEQVTIWPAESIPGLEARGAVPK